MEVGLGRRKGGDVIKSIAPKITGTVYVYQITTLCTLNILQFYLSIISQ